MINLDEASESVVETFGNEFGFALLTIGINAKIGKKKKKEEERKTCDIEIRIRHQCINE